MVAVAWSAPERVKPGHHRPIPVRPESGGYKVGPGPWAVGVADRLVLKLPPRHKNVEVTVRYPRVKGRRPSGSFPLVVFCHGSGGSRAAFPELTTHWASHGFVVVIPSQPEAVGRRGARQVPPRPFDVDQLDRLGDVISILDSIGEIERKMDGFHGRHAVHIDRDRIGIAGYSTGALTAQMAVGVKVRLARAGGETELKSVGDPRVKAAIVISGQGTVNRLLTRESWSDLSKPLLVMTGSRDVVRMSRETPESRQEPFHLAKPGQKYLVFIEGAPHSSYEGRAEPSVDGDELSDAELHTITAVTDSATLAFWDAFLDNDERARDYLASDDLVKFSGGKAQLKRR